MTKRPSPPGRTLVACVVMVKPRGPHQLPRCSALVHMLKTSSRGASNARVTTISFSPFDILLLLLLLLKLAQVVVEAIEDLLPEFAVFVQPVRPLFQPRPLQPARTPLRLAPAGDEPRPLQHLE